MPGIQQALNKLTERERNIVELRFYKGKTQMEVADEIGISQAQVSRLEKNWMSTACAQLSAPRFPIPWFPE